MDHQERYANIPLPLFQMPSTPLYLTKTQAPLTCIFFLNRKDSAETYMKGRNCWNVNFTICCRGLLPFFFLCVCAFSFFPLPSLIPSSSVLFHECAAILAVWSHGVSASMALTGWKIQCHMVAGGDCPLLSCFKPGPSPGNPVSYTSPKAPVTLPCPPLVQSVSLSRSLTWACPCSPSFLSVHVLRDLFSLFILMLRILITRLQDP